MPAHLYADVPAWLRRSRVAGVGALLALVAVVLTAGFLTHEWRSVRAAEIQSDELYARVLQDHAERTFNTVDIVLRSLAYAVHADVAVHDVSGLGPELARAQLGLPFLRSLSLVDVGGRVLASSGSENVGAQLDLGVIHLPVYTGVDSLGPPVSGRDLADAGRKRPTAAAVAVGRTFLPLVHALPDARGEARYIVAVLNPDFFSSAYELTLADDSRAAGLFLMDATMVAGTSGLRKSPGEDIRKHTFFIKYLPARQSGSFVGPGIDGESVATAFRTLRTRPLVVVVESSEARMVERVGRTAAWAVGVCGLALTVLGALVVTGWRSLRSHELVRDTLDATRASVAASERNLRTLVDSVHELIFRADAEGRITFVNGRWEALTGRPAANVIGRRLAELCPDHERATCDALFVAGALRAATVTVHLSDAHGRTLTLELSVAAVVEPNGATTGFAGFAVDVSEREASRLALESQLRFTAQLLDVSPTPLFVKDGSLRFTTVNRAWLDLMGWELADVLGRTSAELYGTEASKHNDHDARLMETGERSSYENRLVMAGKPARDTVVTKVRFTGADGRAAGMVGSIIDVTEFRDAERSIREARDAAELASRVKSEFLANISHELRTPLQAIIGFSDLGSELASGAPDVLDMFADIEAGGRRMLTLVNGLLDVAQMDGADGPRTLRRCDVAQLVRDAATQVRPQAVVRDQRIHLRGLDAAVTANADPARFQQAVRNVLANAVRYAPSGTAIEVVCVDGGPAGVELTVRDVGPGFPDDELEYVFESFVQSSRTRDGSGGAGLGLTIARKIMNAHGGQVVAANAPGGGALMRLTLPASRQACGSEDSRMSQDEPRSIVEVAE